MDRSHSFFWDNPHALAMATIVVWSFGSYLSRLVSIESEYALLSVMYLVTFLTLASYCWRKYGKSLMGRSKKLIFPAIFIGPLGYYIYSLGLIKSYRAFGSASETTVLNYTWPVFTIFFTVLFFSKEKDVLRVAAFKWLGIVLCFVSVIILASRGDIYSLQVHNAVGIVWGLVSGVSYGIFSSYCGTLEKDENDIFLLLSITFSFVLSIPFSLLDVHALTSITFRGLTAAVAIGCVLDGIGYILWTNANILVRKKRGDIAEIGTLMFVLPFLSLVIVSILLHEKEILQSYFILSLSLLVVSSVMVKKAELLSAGLDTLIRRFARHH